MRELAELAREAEPQFLSQAVRELVASIPWGHHANVLAKVADPAARLYYLQATARLGWSRNVLLNQIKAGAFERAVQGKTHNFDLACPCTSPSRPTRCSRAVTVWSSSDCGRRLRSGSWRIASSGICGTSSWNWAMASVCRPAAPARPGPGNTSWICCSTTASSRPWSLLTSRSAFEPEFAGKMDFYLNLLNKTERAPDDQPSIGIILCAEKDSLEVEFALKTKPTRLAWLNTS